MNACWGIIDLSGRIWITLVLLLKVPSVVSPESWNYLFNPLHPEAGSAVRHRPKKV